MSGSISCGMGHTYHSCVLSVTWTVGYAIKSSMTLNRVIHLNLTPFEVFMSALTLDSSCRHCRVLCCVSLSSSFSSVKQEQIISTLSVWGYVECEKILPGDVQMGCGKILSAGQEVWELVDLHKVIKKCLGEEITGTKRGSPRKGNKKGLTVYKVPLSDWALCLITTVCTVFIQAFLNYISVLSHSSSMCVSTAWTDCHLLGGLAAGYWCQTGGFRCPYTLHITIWGDPWVWGACNISHHESVHPFAASTDTDRERKGRQTSNMCACESGGCHVYSV